MVFEYAIFKLDDKSEAIEAVAASWLVQEEEGLTAEQAAEFARWRAADPKHAAAVAMLVETCGILQRMPEARTKLDPAAPRKLIARGLPAVVVVPSTLLLEQ